MSPSSNWVAGHRAGTGGRVVAARTGRPGRATRSAPSSAIEPTPAAARARSDDREGSVNGGSDREGCGRGEGGPIGLAGAESEGRTGPTGWSFVMRGGSVAASARMCSDGRGVVCVMARSVSLSGDGARGVIVPSSGCNGQPGAAKRRSGEAARRRGRVAAEGRLIRPDDGRTRPGRVERSRVGGRSGSREAGVLVRLVGFDAGPGRRGRGRRGRVLPGTGDDAQRRVTRPDADDSRSPRRPRRTAFRRLVCRSLLARPVPGRPNGRRLPRAMFASHERHGRAEDARDDARRECEVERVR